MKPAKKTFFGGPIFDGESLHDGFSVQTENGVVVAIGPQRDIGLAGDSVDLSGDILSPGYVDLQVNGGGGIMFNDAPTVATLGRMAAAHRRLGTEKILPTLITDTPAQTRAAIEAVAAAVEDGVTGIAGLHLEGPHLSLARKGAHDPNLIREMTNEDLSTLIGAAQRLPVLKITIAPESVTLDQTREMARAGILISIGHTDADYETCLAYQRAGARCVTHLFNAMSQLSNRAPGVVGAAIDCGALSAGLIADAIHVHPAAMRAALAAKVGPGSVFLVTDAMAPAGTDIESFELNGRRITRAQGRLTLPDGTLAGADLDLTGALRVLTHEVGYPLEDSLRAATSIPADLAGITAGRLVPGTERLLIRIRKDLEGCEILELSA